LNGIPKFHLDQRGTRQICALKPTILLSVTIAEIRHNSSTYTPMPQRGTLAVSFLPQLFGVSVNF
jgi:hypothetical protein